LLPTGHRQTCAHDKQSMSPHYTPSFASNAQRVQIPGVEPIPKLAICQEQQMAKHFRLTTLQNNKFPQINSDKTNISAKQLRENKHFLKTFPRKQTFPQNNSAKTNISLNSKNAEISKYVCRKCLRHDAELFTSNVYETTPTKPILHD
jgi:hypothetical protein